MPTIQYFFESAFCLACFYGLYWVFLRKETFFQANRWYLMATSLLSLVIPAVIVDLDNPLQAPSTVSSAPPPVLPELVAQSSAFTAKVFRPLEAPVHSAVDLKVGDVLNWIYLGMAVLLFLVLIARLYRLFQLIRTSKKADREGFVLAATSDQNHPVASFFSYIFWHKTDFSEEDKLIIEHELVHVRQWHSFDVLLMEMMVVWQWFNPLIYLFRKSLQTVHEYIADAYIIRHTQQRHAYASLLVKQYQDRARPDLLSTFHSQLKHRLVMLAKSPSPGFARAKYLLVIPVALSMMLLFSFRLIDRIPVPSPIKKAFETVNLYTAQIKEIQIFGENPRVAAEPTPYIFYWGMTQCKIEHDPNSGKYFGEINTSLKDLKTSVRKEPRLYNGRSLEQFVRFSFENQQIISDYNNEGVYDGIRPFVEAALETVAPGSRLEIKNLDLPNGAKGVLSINIDDTTPTVAVAPTEVNYQLNPELAAILMSNDILPTIQWGNFKAAPNGRAFYDLEEFYALLDSRPVITKASGPMKDLLFNCMVRNEQTQILSFMDGNGYEWDSLVVKLRQIKPQIATGTVFWLIATSVPPGNTGRDQTIANLVNPGNSTTLGFFNIVDKDDPRKELAPDFRHDFMFQWGPYTTQLMQLYGVEFEYKKSPFDSLRYLYADRMYAVSSIAFTAKELVQMTQRVPKLFKDDKELANVTFDITCKGRTAKMENGWVPLEFVNYLRENLQDYDKIIVSNIRAEGAVLQPIIITFEVKPVYPKTPLGKANSSSASLEQAVQFDVPSPNPATSKTRLTFRLPADCKGDLMVINESGSIVWALRTDFHKGENTFPLNVKDLKRDGLFTVVIDSPYGRAEQKLVVAAQ